MKHFDGGLAVLSRRARLAPLSAKGLPEKHI